MSPHKYYDRTEFRKGFSLLENGVEKQKFSKYLLKLMEASVNKTSNFTSHYKILDIGGGSGVIWKHFSQKAIFYSNVSKLITSNKLKVHLIDSSKKQIDSANGLTKKIAWLNVKKTNLYQYHTKKRFDLIVCFHFFYSIPEDKQIHIFRKIYSMLSPHGNLIVVQPAKYDSLSSLKRLLRQKIFGQNYFPNRIKAVKFKNLTPRSIYESNPLIIKENELTGLAYFLLGEGNKPSKNEVRDAVDLIKGKYKKKSGNYRFKLFSQYINFKKN